MSLSHVGRLHALITMLTSGSRVVQAPPTWKADIQEAINEVDAATILTRANFLVSGT